MIESKDETFALYGGKQALLLIDFQNDFLADNGRLPVARNQVASVLAAANAAIANARHTGDPILAVGNEFRTRDWLGNLLRRNASIAGSWGAGWDERVPIGEIEYLPKSSGSAFSNPKLEGWLNANGIQRLVITGLFAKACITSTVKDGLEYRYSVAIIHDAVACSSDRSRRRALNHLTRLGARLL